MALAAFFIFMLLNYSYHLLFVRLVGWSETLPTDCVIFTATWSNEVSLASEQSFYCLTFASSVQASFLFDFFLKWI